MQRSNGNAISAAMGTPAPKPYLIDGDTTLEPGETLIDLQARLGGMEDKLAPVSEKIVEGDGTTVYYSYISSCYGCS